MAHIDDLVKTIPDVSLRKQLQAAVSRLRKGRNFGLVFEEHIPETVLLPSAGIQAGATVVLRDQPTGTRFDVISLEKDKIEVSSGHDLKTTLAVRDVLVLKKFGEPIYPILTPVGSLRRAPEKPSQIIINGENFHALQLLLFQHLGQVDCIYVDPPYNSGARDWKYNNRYVDDADDWRHSKWLSFMEKRLRLAKDLLKPETGVLVVTVDEKEVHHLGMLLEQIFPNAIRQMVTIVINPLGQARKQELARVEEYAFFVFQGKAAPSPVRDDLLSEGAAPGKQKKVRWEWLIRGGPHSRRDERPNLFFPVYVEPATRSIASIGNAIPRAANRNEVKIPDGLVAVWPLNTNGDEGNWRCSPTYLRQLVDQGYAKLGAYDAKRDRYSVLYLGKAQIKRIESGQVRVIGHDAKGAVILEGETDQEHRVTAKTVWNRPSHRAGEYGSTLLKRFLPGREFPFPKSLYAVLDTLRVVVGDRPNALILDFFAGSGTTLHATCLLNAEDGGQRRCVLVTNNEVSEEESKSLATSGLNQGDAEYDARGIFELITLPRIRAALSGRHENGKPILGSYLNGRNYDAGFEENFEAYRLDYANPVDVELGFAFQAIVPALWMASGSIGDPKRMKAVKGILLPEDSNFAVLLNEDRIKDFVQRVGARDDITHAWLVTDSERAFADMRSLLSRRIKTSMLYRDFLGNFELRARVGR
jgi:adenine-specific DNA-methyltransferase